MSLATIIIAALLLSALMSAAWLIQRISGNSGWVDTIWSLATGIGCLVAIGLADALDSERQWLAAGIVTIWSLRLASHIGNRSAGAAEDPRYAALKEEWGESHSSRLFWFLQIQAAAAFILMLAPLAAVTGPAPFPAFTDLLAILVALTALAGEALADRQLSRFKKTNKVKGAVCEVGLWKYSRHPNYFFEWLFWCAWPIMALGGISQAPWHFVIALGAPFMMYWLLVHVSGIPPLEKHMLNSRGDAFADYQRRVNAFFPGPQNNVSARQEVTE